MPDATTAARPRRNLRRSKESPSLLSQVQAWEFTGLSRSQWYVLRSAGKLPAAVYVATSTRPFWRRSDLEAWIANLPTSRREAIGAA